MRSKTKRPDLSKYVPKVLNVDALHTMMCDTIDTVRKYCAMSPEEREKELYESLRKKYEGAD